MNQQVELDSPRRSNRTLLGIALASLLLGACGERITPEEIEDVSASVADVLVAIQYGADSTARHRIADSVASAHGYDGWAELSNEIGVIATEPDRLRSLLDTTQRRIEKRIP